MFPGLSRQPATTSGGQSAPWIQISDQTSLHPCVILPRNGFLYKAERGKFYIPQEESRLPTRPSARSRVPVSPYHPCGVDMGTVPVLLDIPSTGSRTVCTITLAFTNSQHQNDYFSFDDLVDKPDTLPTQFDYVSDWPQRLSISTSMALPRLFILSWIIGVMFHFQASSIMFS